MFDLKHIHKNIHTFMLYILTIFCIHATIQLIKSSIEIAHVSDM